MFNRDYEIEPRIPYHYNSANVNCRVNGWTSSSKIRFYVSMTENSSSGIFGPIHNSFGDSATRIANIYTLDSNSCRRGVVDTSLWYDCLSKLYWHCAIFFCFFFFCFLFFVLVGGGCSLG